MQVSLQFSRRLFGPDRAEIAERSNNVGPDIDYATHDLPIIARPKGIDRCSIACPNGYGRSSKNA
jgi:hypothetical protein